VYLARSCPRCRAYFCVVIAEPKGRAKPRFIHDRCITKSTGRSIQVMAQMAIDKILPGPKLDALTAEKVFGWRNVHQHDDRDGFYGKRQDKTGYWRLAKVPQYSTNFLNAYSIEGRMEQLGRLDRYLRQLFRITHANNSPPIGLPRTNGAGHRSKLWVSTVRSFRLVANKLEDEPVVDAIHVVTDGV